MDLKTVLYDEHKQTWPRHGRYILAQYDDESVSVYQAYRRAIGDFAAANGYFGGPAFSYSRMTWIKPNFLWMMFRSGWGTKKGQEVVLALRLKREFFEGVLAKAVPSTYVRELYETRQEWQQAVSSSDVRLQWDPDHGPRGQPLERRAIQLGLRGRVLEGFKGDALLAVRNISQFVSQQREHLGASVAELRVPEERVFLPRNLNDCRALRLDGVLAAGASAD